MGCSGCNSKTGGCSSGGCNRMDVYDWLADIPQSYSGDECKIVEVSFNHGSRKDFFRNATSHYFTKGDLVTVEGVSGFDMGEISLSGELVRLQLKKKRVEEHDPGIKQILRKSSDRDLELMKQNKAREHDVLVRARAIARQMKLEMKLSIVEIQADGRKATFFYTADGRVDFRELIKVFASEFKVKVEMRQIGARQEAAKLGGIGSSGRELCCSTWINNFKSVTTVAARYQNLSINQAKLSGQCGRLKCCLNYELDTYLDALQGFPNNADILETTKGNATLIKKDIFRNLMWYMLPDSSKHYPLSIATVRKIKEMNNRGAKPDVLEEEELVSRKTKEVEPEFVDVVGQISLKSFEKANKRRKFKQKDQTESNRSHAGNTKQNHRSAQQKPSKPSFRKDRENPNRKN